MKGPISYRFSRSRTGRWLVAVLALFGLALGAAACGGSGGGAHGHTTTTRAPGY